MHYYRITDFLEVYSDVLDTCDLKKMVDKITLHMVISNLEAYAKTKMISPGSFKEQLNTQYRKQEYVEHIDNESSEV